VTPTLVKRTKKRLLKQLSLPVPDRQPAAFSNKTCVRCASKDPELPELSFRVTTRVSDSESRVNTLSDMGAVCPSESRVNTLSDMGAVCPSESRVNRLPQHRADDYAHVQLLTALSAACITDMNFNA